MNTAHQPSRLWLVRHARPLVEPGICYGRLDMDADVRATAHAAQTLHRALPVNCQVLHSPLRRCRQLAQALQALRPGLAVTPDPQLLEMDFGDWEGLPWETLDRQAIDAWAADLAHCAPGRGETLAAMLLRVDRALQQARLQAGNHAPPHDIVWITHAGVARCVQWLMHHGNTPPQSAQWTQPAPEPGSWIVVALRS